MRRAEDLKPVVTVNVYHASQDQSSAAMSLPGCCGAYHTGVEIHGVEYAFAAGPGVYECRPGDYGEVLQRIPFQSLLTSGEIKSSIDRLRPLFPGDSYHIVLNNCNHFSNSLINACTHGDQGIPGWINRAAWWASWFKCCFCLCGDNSNAEPSSRPLLPNGGSSREVPLQQSPMFAGEGLSLSTDRGARPLTQEEQRQVRLRNLGGGQ